MTGIDEEIDARFSASPTGTDPQFAELLAQVQSLNVRIQHIQASTAALRSAVWLAGLTCLAISILCMFGLYRYGDLIFGQAIGLETVSDTAVVNIETHLDELSRRTESNTLLVNKLLAGSTNQSTQALPRK